MSALAFALALTAAAPSEQRRCGWLDNPTPQNWTLTDGAGEWTLSEQGGYVAEGFDELPDTLKGRDWIHTNVASYGYGCACVTGVFDRGAMHALTLRGGRARPLRTCRRERGLPRR